MLALRAECLETGLLSSMEARRSNPVAACFICSEACGTEVIPAFYPMVFNRNGVRSAGDAEMPCSARNKAVSTKQSESGLFHCRLFRQAKRVVHIFMKNPVRGVRACFGEFVQRGWRGELLPGDRMHRSVTTSATIGKSDGGEKLNHERPNRIGKEGLASKILKRRC
mgnify:CR=1 FL=1